MRQNNTDRNYQGTCFIKLHRVMFSATCCLYLFANQNAFSQDTLPSLEKISEAISLNSRKVTNLKLRSFRVVAISPDYLTNPPEGANKPLLVKGKYVTISRDLILLDGNNRFVDENNTQIGDEIVLQRQTKHWFDAGKSQTITLVESNQFLNDKGQVDDVAKAANNRPETPMPLGPVEALQIYMSGLSQEVAYGPKTRVIGYEKFHGLDCLRLEWGEKDKSSSWGYQLVCPQRDWKILSQEIYNKDISDSLRLLYLKSVVDRLERKGDAWIPYSIYTECQKTDANGKVSISQEKLRIIEAELDSVDASLLFSPELSPGTLFVEQNGTKPGSLDIIGGSMQSLITDIRNGNLSFLDIENKDLGVQ